jgi:imidazole glycerol-phosphate synthase subunit HisF
MRPRVIPVLLVRDGGLVKSIKFSDHKYIGDPINAARIFTELRADELLFLDITATPQQRLISLELLREVADEGTMPFSAGGGVSKLTDIERLISCGVEKVVIGSRAISHPDFVSEAAKEFGSSTICVCIDVKRDLFGRYRAFDASSRKSTQVNVVDLAREMTDRGVGELIIQSVDRDGTMDGFDIDLTRAVSDTVEVPVIAAGGAGGAEDLIAVFDRGHASAVAAGSLFVYQSKKRGVLINYTNPWRLPTAIRSET